MRSTPDLRHEWEAGDVRLVLRIPAVSAQGFDVELEANDNGGLELRRAALIRRSMTIRIQRLSSATPSVFCATS